ncbi:protein mono-ADP-ribosyltransferase PARP14 isoform X2 [Calypte anna]|uniref:protein mono-ADP-ribosyltransferase PARP14 isoform X2 n=1 Tax=Calypte anna TaxID=9244 RepID=UPI0011C3F491|nr:protein mono-ADP-ribosyltransferase PARP14 isoform X2 [Calypte anna]
MAELRPGALPLLVSGDWGAAEPPRALKKKLLCYFQSQKRSGGGECELQTDDTGHILICFTQPEVRQRVLDRGIHELEWEHKGRLSLLVTELPAGGQPAQELGRAGGTEAPESRVKLEAEKATSRNSAIVVTTAHGEEIEDDILEMYFENKKKSGGGLIESYIRKGLQRIITFENEEDAQEVLQRRHHSVKKIDLLVKPWQEETLQNRCQVEDPQGSLPSNVVLLENVQETAKEGMLILLIENISGLSDEDGDFSVEMIPENRAAVVTFTGNIDAGEFAKIFNQNYRANKQNITARCLELTKSIRAENIQPNISSDFLTVYFENKRNGNAHVVDVQQLPDEDAAIVTFSHHKDVINILAKKHSLNNTPISVYPYYVSVGVALYGKEGPQIKKPDPITVPLNPYIWQYLQRNRRLVEAVNEEMAKCNCEVTWPEPNCADPVVTLHPSASLFEQKRLAGRLIKTWNKNVSTAFSHCMLKYKATECQVSSEVWEAIRNSFKHDEVLIIPLISKNLVVLVGEKEVMKNAEQHLVPLIEKTTREIEREKQRIERIVLLDTGEYAILQSTGLEENVCKQFPDLQMIYDHRQKTLSLCGLPEEVNNVKGEILDSLHKMVKKRLDVNPYIFQFLEHIDNETMCQSLFMSKQIRAFYEVSAGAIILKGNAPEDLIKAEEEIKKELDDKSLTVEDQSVLQKEEWKMLTKQYCSEGAITITQKESQVIIAGCSEAVAKASEELFNFIDENTQVQEVIGGKPVAVIVFFEKEKTDVWGAIQSNGVQVDFNTQQKCRVISLSGPKREVLKGVTLVEQTLSGLHSKRVVIKEPGVRSYFKEQEHFFATRAKQDFKCLVMLEESGEQGEEHQEHSDGDKPYRRVTIGKTVVAVYKGNLCNYPVDVVVNAANEDLQHHGGLAEALSKAAGPELQEECNELVRKNGSLKPGCTVITGAGKLPCKNVIHAVGPRWRTQEAQKCISLLKRTVKNCLKLADTYNHCSIALPVISGGFFGFPLQTCTHTIVSSVKETLEESMEDSNLKEVHLVDIVQDNIKALNKALEEVFSCNSVSSEQLQPITTVPQRKKSKISQSSKNFPFVTTQEGLDIVLKKGSIEDATTDIVVTSVGKDLQLGGGPLSKVLLTKAGPMLQVELEEEGRGKIIEEGSVWKTRSYNLNCHVVLHAVLPWFQQNGSVKIFGNIVTKCLQIAEELSLKSITFPAIGTGRLEYPKPCVAKLLFDKVFDFSSKNGINSLQEVHFLLHPKDTDNIRAFNEELENRCGNTVGAKGKKNIQKKSSPGTASSDSSPRPSEDVYEMMFGSILFQVAKGDITQEDTDAIVNITNHSFNLKTGVSRAILDGAGKTVQKECAQLAALADKSYIITRGGNLPCKNIIHFISQNDIKLLVSTVLEECETQKYTSVTFPAIGTGEAGRDPAVVADNIIDSVANFAKSTSAPSLKVVKVVIFQPHLVSVFHKSLQKRESYAKSFLSKLTAFWSSEKRSPKEKPKIVLEKKVDVAVVHICGENKQKVEEAEKWLKTAILQEQLQKDITDETISLFGEAESKELCDLQKKYKIALYLDGCTIQISGIMKDVLLTHSAILEMIHRVKAAKQEEAKAEILQNVIEWKYFEKDFYVPFDSHTNMRLEDAFVSNQECISVIINEKKYTVYVKAKYAEDDKGERINILRLDKAEDQLSTMLPATWDDQQNQRLRIVELKPDSRDYREVQERFLRTCPSFKIEKIERVQNPSFWKLYQITKCDMDKKNGNTNNERLLFHGTSKESLTLINNHGFNRSYAGAHAANYGKGTYFAVDAAYSSQDLYSKPDQNGRKYMYLARVLVGEYSQGIKGSITPAAKNANNTLDLYDSSTDNVNKPTMFIIFSDTQAYPEYLITFTK